MNDEATRGPMSLPWGLGDLRRIAAANAVGVVALGAAWLGADSSPVVRQMTWLLVGVGGLAVLGGASCAWLLVGRRAVGVRRRQMLQPLSRMSAGRAGTDHRWAEAYDENLVWVEGMRRYHRHDCQMVAGKRVGTAARSAHEQAGRVGCGVCQP